MGRTAFSVRPQGNPLRPSTASRSSLPARRRRARSARRRSKFAPRRTTGT